MRNQVKIEAFKDEMSKIVVIKVMSDVTKRSTLECKNILDSVTPHGVILLNESFITVEQWKEISVKCTNLITWKYAEN